MAFGGILCEASKRWLTQIGILSLRDLAVELHTGSGSSHPSLVDSSLANFRKDGACGSWPHSSTKTVAVLAGFILARICFVYDLGMDSGVRALLLSHLAWIFLMVSRCMLAVATFIYNNRFLYRSNLEGTIRGFESFRKGIGGQICNLGECLRLHPSLCRGIFRPNEG